MRVFGAGEPMSWLRSDMYVFGLHWTIMVTSGMRREATSRMNTKHVRPHPPSITGQDLEESFDRAHKSCEAHPTLECYILSTLVVAPSLEQSYRPKVRRRTMTTHGNGDVPMIPSYDERLSDRKCFYNKVRVRSLKHEATQRAALRQASSHPRRAPFYDS